MLSNNLNSHCKRFLPQASGFLIVSKSWLQMDSRMVWFSLKNHAGLSEEIWSKQATSGNTCKTYFLEKYSPMNEPCMQIVSTMKVRKCIIKAFKIVFKKSILFSLSMRPKQTHENHVWHPKNHLSYKKKCFLQHHDRFLQCVRLIKPENSQTKEFEERCLLGLFEGVFIRWGK